MSDQQNNMYLSEDEQEQIQAEVPALAKAIDSGSPAAGAWLASWRARKENPEQVAKKQSKEIQKEVAQATPPTTQLTFHSILGYPTDMTRTSPFFPLNQRELGKREYLEDFVITSAGWGEITYTGPKLSIFDEDVFMAILAILNNVTKEREETEVEGRKTYTYTGTLAPLFKLMGYKNRPGKQNYNRLRLSLKRLSGAVIEMQISDGKTKKGKKRPAKRININNILSNVDLKDDAVSITINPFFYESYCQGLVTLYDLQKRTELAGSVAKALYRFIQSHKSGKWQGHFLTLADAINLDREKPGFRIKESIKRAMTELKKHKIITKQSGFKKDIVILERCKVSLKSSVKSIE